MGATAAGSSVAVGAAAAVGSAAPVGSSSVVGSTASMCAAVAVCTDAAVGSIGTTKGGATERLAAPMGYLAGAPCTFEESIVGKRALLRGLVRMPEFNGEWGKVEAYDAGQQRYIVRVLRDTGMPIMAKLQRKNLLIPHTVALRFDDDGSQVTSRDVHSTSAAPQMATTSTQEVDAQPGLNAVGALVTAVNAPEWRPAKASRGSTTSETWRPKLRPVGDGPSHA